MPATLLIAQHFGRPAGPAARRLLHVGRSFAAEGPVYAIRSGPLDPAATGFAHVETVPSYDLRRLLSRGKDTQSVNVAVKAHWSVRRLLPLRQSFPFVLLTDDGGPYARFRAYQKACELIEAHAITTVFSSFRPWSDHLVARRLKVRYPSLRWIADFRDLPVDAVRRDVWFPALQKRWGKRVVRPADEVWVVSEGQRKQLSDWHDNVQVVRNALRALPPQAPPPETERFTVVYTGSLYPGLQSVAPLVRALQHLLEDGTVTPHQVRVIYRGKDASIFRRWVAALPPTLLDVGPSVAPATAQKMQHAAQVLLLLNWSAPGYYGVLTAKLWDYLSTGRPILALVNGPGDRELTDIIEGAGAGAVFGKEQQREVETWLRHAISRWKEEGALPWGVDRDELRKYLAASK